MKYIITRLKFLLEREKERGREYASAHSALTRQFFLNKTSAFKRYRSNGVSKAQKSGPIVFTHTKLTKSCHAKGYLISLHTSLNT